MAMGDEKRARNMITYQGDLAQGNLNNLRGRVVDQMYPTFWNNYNNAVNRQTADYGNLMGGWSNMAQTGGFSPQDVSSMRARAIAPTRAIMQNATRNINRNKALQGGYSPGYQAAMSRIQRDTGQAISDANVNTEAALAELRQRGKIAGLQGGTGLYGATPGLVNTFGNQALRNADQQIDIENLQGRLGLGLINSQIAASQIPGTFETWLQRAGGISDIIKNMSTLGK